MCAFHILRCAQLPSIQYQMSCETVPGLQNCMTSPLLQKASALDKSKGSRCNRGLIILLAVPCTCSAHTLFAAHVCCLAMKAHNPYVQKHTALSPLCSQKHIKTAQTLPKYITSSVTRSLPWSSVTPEILSLVSVTHLHPGHQKQWNHHPAEDLHHQEPWKNHSGLSQAHAAALTGWGHLCAARCGALVIWCLVSLLFHGRGVVRCEGHCRAERVYTMRCRHFDV